MKFGLIPSGSSGTCAERAMELMLLSPSCEWALPGPFDPSSGQVVMYSKRSGKEVLSRFSTFDGCIGDAGENLPGWYYGAQAIQFCQGACGKLDGSAGLTIWYSAGCGP